MSVEDTQDGDRERVEDGDSVGNHGQLSENRDLGARSLQQAAAAGGDDGIIELAEYDLMAEDELPAEDYLLAMEDIEALPLVASAAQNRSEDDASLAGSPAGLQIGSPIAASDARTKVAVPPKFNKQADLIIPPTERRPSFFQRMREIWGSPHAAQR